MRAANKFFQNNISFYKSFFSVDDLEKDLSSEDVKEVALFGRSNVGKSSLLNALSFNQKIAFTSKMPGCTRSLNFYKFALNNKFFLADLPGYGYAKIAQSEIVKLTGLITNYFIKRKQLKCVFLLIDSRVGVQENDAHFMNFFESNCIKYQIVLTKIDKCSSKDLSELDAVIMNALEASIYAVKKTLKVSSKKNIGIDDLRSFIYEKA